MGIFFPQKSLVRVKIIHFRLEKMENSLPHLSPHYLISMPWSLEKIVQFQELHLYGWAIHLSDFFQLRMFHLVDIHVLWGKIAEFEEQWINAHTNISVACCGQQTREVCPYLVMWACQQLSSSHDPWMNHHLNTLSMTLQRKHHNFTYLKIHGVSIPATSKPTWKEWMQSL